MGLAVLLDPGIVPEAQEILVIPIIALPFSPDLFVISVDHTDRAPAEFHLLNFVFHGCLTF